MKSTVLMLNSPSSCTVMRSDGVTRQKETKLQILTDDNSVLLKLWCAAINLSIRHSRLIILPSKRAHFLASRSVDFEIGFEAETLKKGTCMRNPTVTRWQTKRYRCDTAVPMIWLLGAFLCKSLEKQSVVVLQVAQKMMLHSMQIANLSPNFYHAFWGF